MLDCCYLVTRVAIRIKYTGCVVAYSVLTTGRSTIRSWACLPLIKPIADSALEILIYTGDFMEIFTQKNSGAIGLFQRSDTQPITLCMCTRSSYYIASLLFFSLYSQKTSTMFSSTASSFDADVLCHRPMH